MKDVVCTSSGWIVYNRYTGKDEPKIYRSREEAAAIVEREREPEQLSLFK